MSTPTLLLNAWGFMKSTKFLVGLGVVLFLSAVGFGTYKYLKYQSDERVNNAIESADLNASNRTLQTQQEAQSAATRVEIKTRVIREQEIRDYTNVSNDISNASEAQRNAPVPPLIIDTLNNLDRLRSARGETSPSSTGDAGIPVG